MSRPHFPRRVSLALALAVVVASVGRARATDSPITVTNPTNVTATDLHLFFGDLGGDITNVAINGGPAAQSIAITGTNVDITWANPSIAGGANLNLTVTAPLAVPGDTPQSIRWTEFGNTINGATPLWPVALQPSVTGNFGTDEVPNLHAGLDINAAVNTPLRAPVTLTLLGGTGNYVMATDGTNLWIFAHAKKTVGANTNDFNATQYDPVNNPNGDVGRPIARGADFGFILGTGNAGGGSFDHVHLSYIPGQGGNNNVLVNPADPTMGYKTAAAVSSIAGLFGNQTNPLLLYDVKDPAASDGNNAPEIGPLFYRPKSDNVAGFTEFGQRASRPGLRDGTFINGEVGAIEQITDDQGGIQPAPGVAGRATVPDPRDNTINLDAVIVSDPFKVSYKVTGTGVVAGSNIPERQLVQFDQNEATYAPQIAAIYDTPVRDVTPPGNHPPYNHSYILTDATNGVASTAESWFTRARKNSGGQPDGTGAATARFNAEGLFPDGVYQVDGYGFDIGADGSPADKTSVGYQVRVNNWKQTAEPDKGAAVPNPQRADDTFAKDGIMMSTATITQTYNAAISEPIFCHGNNYLAQTTYEWFIFPHRAIGWFDEDSLAGATESGFFGSDANGFIDSSFVTFASDFAPGTSWDIIIDYDANNEYSWTFDGLGAFNIIPEPASALLLCAGAAFLAMRRRNPETRAAA